MRSTKLTFAVAFLVSATLAEELFLRHLLRDGNDNINIDFRYDLTCAQCIRGGYFFCDQN